VKISLLALVLPAVLVVSGCAVRHVLTPAPAPTVGNGPISSGGWEQTTLLRDDGLPRRVRIDQYRTRDGVEHRFDGYVTLQGDSLNFLAHSGTSSIDTRLVTQAVLVAGDVASIRRVDQASSIARSTLLAGAIVGAALWWMVINQSTGGRYD